MSYCKAGCPPTLAADCCQSFATAPLAENYMLYVFATALFPGFDDPNYLIVAGVDLSDSNSELDVNAYLGAGELVYASRQNLYVTASRPIDIFLAPQLVLSTGLAVTSVPPGVAAAISTAGETEIEPPEPTELNDEERTDIYKFSLSDSRATFVAMGDVPGSILNQYSINDTARILPCGHDRARLVERRWRRQ